MTTVTLNTAEARAAKADILVVALIPGAEGPHAPLPETCPPELLSMLSSLGATGRAGEVLKAPAPADFTAPVILAVGLGPVEGIGISEAEVLRRAAGNAARALAGVTKAAFAFPSFNDPWAVTATVEGLLGGAYAFTAFKSKAPSTAPLGAAIVLTPLAGTTVGRTALKRGLVVAEAITSTRDLVNTPPGDLPPASMAAVAVRWAEKYDLDIEVLDERALKRGKYGGILGVGRGSANPPRLVRMTYKPAKGRPKAHLALVGKGITFDSGGLSLKPPEAMITMKCDMSGAAAVLAATAAIARLGLPIQVTTYAPMAENMPSGLATRPGDVLVTHSGRTVEVLNTDAEGRLVLADALERACQDKPDLIVDVATLTGACVVALGRRIAGVFSNDEGVLEALPVLAADAGDQMWPLPMPEEMREALDSPIADLKNIADRPGGALTAALFLREFIHPGQRWAHVDIAGPAFNDKGPYGRTPAGATGAPVATLVRIGEALASGEL